jgi:hypothetical protein
MWADRLRREGGGGGVGAGNREFCGPCEIARADRQVLFGAHKTRGTRNIALLFKADVVTPRMVVARSQFWPPILSTTLSIGESLFYDSPYSLYVTGVSREDRILRGPRSSFLGPTKPLPSYD